MRTVLIDDIQVNLQALSKLISEYLPDLQIVGEAHSVASGVEVIQQKNPELVILDIELGDGTGFDLLKKCPPNNYNVIFVTAYDQFAIEAIKVNAVDYILKPINIKELINAVHRTRQLNSNVVNQQKEEADSNQVLSFATRNGFEIIEIKTIIRCEADGKYTNCYLNSGKKITSSKNLKVFEEILPEDNFFRIHHSHLINIKEIVSFDRMDLIVHLKNGDVIPISQRKKKLFFEKMRLV